MNNDISICNEAIVSDSSSYEELIWTCISPDIKTEKGDISYDIFLVGEEADYLEDQSDGGAADDMRELEQQAYYGVRNKEKSRYRNNKRPQVGTTIRCAVCGKRILKKLYQTRFCSNKGRGNCKDAYWNNVNDDRRDRYFK